MPTTGVHHCHLVSMPLEARATITLNVLFTLGNAVKSWQDLHEHLAPDNAGIEEAQPESPEFWAAGFTNPQR